MPAPSPQRLPDWEAFYRSYRQPGYVTGFELTHQLGGGMSGLVFRARKQTTGRDYAIKFLKVDDEQVRSAVAQELEQVRLFAAIDHPNLVAIEDRGEVDGIPFVVMAFAGTETLRDRLPGAAGARAELLGLFLQACRGTAALHEHGLVHFDLKPGNVFLKDGVARVGDYGLSKLVTPSRGSLSMGRGTPYYMAPELLQRRGDHRSDIYSLGVMLFEVLTGELPFRGDSEWVVLRQHETAAVVVPEHVPAREREAVLRCLQKDPAQRYQSVHDLIAVLCGGASASTSGAARAVMPTAGLLDTKPGAASPATPVAAGEPAKTRSRRLAAPSRSFWSSPLVMVCALVVAGSFWMKDRAEAGARTAVERRYAAARQRDAIVERGNVRVGPRERSTPRERGERGVREEIQRLAAIVEQAGKKRGRDVQLRPIDAAGVALPKDLPLYAMEVEQVVTASVVTPLEQAHFEQLGYPMVLASVGWLQCRDYRDQEACVAAARVLKLLESATAVEGLAVREPVGAVDTAVARRFAAAADCWRRLVEKCAADSNAYRALILATGKTEAPKKD